MPDSLKIMVLEDKILKHRVAIRDLEGQIEVLRYEDALRNERESEPVPEPVRAFTRTK